MGKNPGPSDWPQANGPEHGGQLPPLPSAPPRQPKRRLSRKTWLIIAGTVISLGIVGSLLPEENTSTGTALSTTTPTPETVAPSTPPVALDKPTLTLTPTPRILTPTPTLTPTLSGGEASLDWWFDQGGNQINSTISVLDQFVAAAQAGDLAGAQLYCSRLQAYASTWSPQNLMALPDPDPAVGAELVQAFDDGRTGTYIAADKCAKFFEKNDMGALSESIQFAAASSTELDKVQTGMLRLQGLTPPWESNADEVPQTPAGTAELPETACAGARFQYEYLRGLSCDEVIAIWDHVQKTGDTGDFSCLAPLPQEGPTAPVICHHRDTEGVGFEARPK